MVVKAPFGDGFHVFLCDTISGKFKRTIPVSAVGWGLKVNDAGTVTASLPVESRELARVDVRAATTPVRQSLGVAYDGQILECGPIWGRKYNPAKESLELTAAGLWSIFDRRKALLPAALAAGQTPQATTLTIVRNDLGSIARELVRGSIFDNPWNGGAAGSLNIVLPADNPGTARKRTYNGFDLAWIGNRLRELSAVTDGPDIRFRPRFNAADPTIVEWVMEYGTADAPLLQQTGPDYNFDATRPKGGIVEIGVDEDATGIASRAWQPGSGQEKNMKLAYATSSELLALGWPWTEADQAKKDVEDQGDLQDGANQLLADSKAPWQQWTASVRADQSPKLGTYLPGDWAVLQIPEGHPILDPGAVRVRIMGFSGDDSTKVKLIVAPIQGRF
jgi:hypothetical protein